jgi:hypothetical protein
MIGRELEDSAYKLPLKRYRGDYTEFFPSNPPRRRIRRTEVILQGLYLEKVPVKH